MSGMEKDEGPVIDMTPEGEFVDPPPVKTGIGAFLVRLVIFGLMVGAVGLMFWTALLVLPLLLLAGVVGYFTAFRSRN
jgi:hypothetical protein